MSDNTAEMLRALHVFRSLGEYLDGRWRLGLAVLGGDNALGAINAPDNSPMDCWNGLRSTHPVLQTLENEWLSQRAPSLDHNLAEHPLGFHFMAAPMESEAFSGTLFVGPLMLSEQRASRQKVIRKSLHGAEVGDSVALEFAKRVPSLDLRDRQHISDLMTVLAHEAARHFESAAPSERRQDQQSRPRRHRYAHIVGESVPMLELFKTMDRISHSEATVYIYGENGTGKELIAQEIHDASYRSDRPFVVQNCSALNDNLLESELFGHVKGSFTGAVNDKPGLFNQADQGTLFLDEIGEMSPALQVKLLRVLQEGTFTAVGDVNVQQVDVRVLCATNRDLREMVGQGTFRQDLFYRVNVINIRLPPLRERKDDIELLINFFLERAASKPKEDAPGRRRGRFGPGGRKRMSPAAMACLMDYDWPGNVRENEIARLLVLCGPMISTIDQDLLSPRIRYRPLPDPVDTAVTTDLSLPDALEQMERAMIFEHLKRCRWNKTKTAEALGVSRRNLIRKVTKYGLDRRRS